MTWQAKRTRWGKSEEQRLGFLRQVLRRPGARLILEHRGTQGHRYAIEPGRVRVSAEEAQALIRRGHIRELDAGLFSDQPQTWISN